MIDVQRIDHVAIAVRSLPDAVRLFADVFGGTYIAGGDDESLLIRTVQFLFPPGVKVELMTPTSPDSYLQRYLDEHGEGFHHMTIFVADVEAAIAELEANGYEVVDTDLRSPRWRQTFVRPRSGFGTLLQIADTDRRWDIPNDKIPLEAVLAGEVVWTDDEPTYRSSLQR